MPCSSKMDQILDECVYKHTSEGMMRHLNCVAPFLPQDNSLPICKSDKKNVLQIYEKLLYFDQRNMCKVPCKKITAMFGMMETDHKTDPSLQNTTLAKIYLKSTVQYTETMVDYPIVSMLAGNLIASQC